MHIIKVENEFEKARIIEQVLADLPEWFGLPDSTKEYIEDGSKLPLWASYHEQEAVGFITLTQSSDECGDVHCMGIKKAYHRTGIGLQLMTALEDEAKKKYGYLQVKTVDQGHYKEYDQTIAFYQACGFVKVEVFPTLWDEWNPCLMMIKKL
ncbi:GNAT family N-acetyltransferase [Streptococcus suis]|nr:GNAT family N-acetyltransferase [Streptococcus suis]